jgi:hypothetical protein
LACTEKTEHNFAAPLLAWQIPVPHSAEITSKINQYEEPLRDVRTFEEDEEQELDIFQDGTND